MGLFSTDYPNFKDQEYKDIKKKCRKSGELWVDPEFPPQDSSLWEGKPRKKRIEWKRPREINPNAKIFVGGHCEDDVNQGEVGNCWFVASVACFALHEELMEKVFPDAEEQELDREDYAGILRFRFYRFGEWVEVCIDDLLPTKKGRLLYMHSNSKNEFWCALLEKAYAKLAGSYEALDAGNSADALSDLSGGVSQVYNVGKDGIRGDEEKESKFFKDLIKALSRDSLINCSMNLQKGESIESKRDNGLVVGHAYTVIKCYELSLGLFGMSGTHKLIKLRNPWGATEWKGKWGDDDPKWNEISDSKKKDLDFTNEDDGEFWMEFHEYLEIFDTTTVCRVINTGRSLTRKRWHLKEMRGQWVPGKNAGGCSNFKETFFSNPQFQFEILEEDDETVQIVLSQRDRRIMDQANLIIGFRIFKVNDDHKGRMTSKKQGTTVAKSTFTDTRDVYQRFELEVGRYVVIPSTFKPDLEGEYILKIFTEDEANVVELK